MLLASMDVEGSGGLIVEYFQQAVSPVLSKIYLLRTHRVLLLHSQLFVVCVGHCVDVWATV